MSWVKKAEGWMDKPRDDRDFSVNDEANERRRQRREMAGEGRTPGYSSPSSTVPTHSPAAQKALDEALKHIDRVRHSSWVKKADTGVENPSGMSWQDFQKEHKFTPVTDDIKQMDLKFETPFLSSLPSETVKEMFEMHGQMDPLSYQEYLRVLIGIIVPLDKMDEFVKSLEMSYNALRAG